MTNDQNTQPPPQWQVLPAIAAWCIPGLGHLILGHKTRAAILFTAIVSLFTLGILIGSINVIDAKEDRLWYAGQLMFGPTTYLLNKHHQNLKQKSNLNNPPQTKFEVSIGRVNELGTLYCTMAGLLNLLAIIDALYRPSAKSQKQTQNQPVLQGAFITRDNPQ